MPDDLVVPAAETSAAPVVDVQQSAPSSDTTVAPDASSTPAPSPGGEQQTPAKDSRLDAVMKALGRGNELAAKTPPVEASAEGKDPAATDPATDPAAEAEPGAEADAKLPFAQHPRFKQVLRQRAHFKAEAEKFTSTIKDLEPKAKNYDSIVTYARNAGMTQEFVGDLFHMGKLMLDDPIAFHQAFRAEWERIETLVGAKLPPDLQQQVQAGKLSPEVAKELALTRTRAELAEGRHKRQTEQSAAERQEAERKRQESEAQEYEDAIVNSVTGWDRQWKGTDPDYAIKQPFVRDRINVRIYAWQQEGKVPTTQEVLKMCAEVREQVAKEMRATLPKRNGISTPGSGTTVTEGVPTPGNKLQIARAALARMQAG